jgi:uncharacterized membrane protein YhhN
MILRLGNIQIRRKAVQKLRPAHRLSVVVVLIIILIPIALHSISIPLAPFVVVLHIIVVGALRASSPRRVLFLLRRRCGDLILVVDVCLLPRRTS